MNMKNIEVKVVERYASAIWANTIATILCSSDADIERIWHKAKQLSCRNGKKYAVAWLDLKTKKTGYWSDNGSTKKPALTNQ